MKFPKCCDVDMQLHLETSRYLEVKCTNCGDVVYIKKQECVQRPQMIDD